MTTARITDIKIEFPKDLGRVHDADILEFIAYELGMKPEISLNNILSMYDITDCKVKLGSLNIEITD